MQFDMKMSTQIEHHQLPHPLMVLAERIFVMLFYKDIELIELQSGVTACAFGGILIIPYLLPARHYALMLAISPGFAAMNNLAEQWVWATVYLSVGLFVLGFLLLNNHYGRILATFAASALWVFLAVMIARAGALSPGVTTYGLLSAVSVLSFWRNCARPRAQGL